MIQNIPIDKIIPHEKNPRTELGDLTELADSIRQSGIFQNLTVVVCQIPEEDQMWRDAKAVTTWRQGYKAIIGHRRLAAAKLAGLKEVPCAIVEMDEKTQIATMLLENMQRADLTVYEQAQGIQMMLDLGEDINSISEKTGFSQSTIRRRVKLLDLDKDTFKATQERDVSLMDYAELDRIKDAALKNEVAKHLGTNNFKSQLAKSIEKQELAEKRAKVIEILETFATKVEDREGYRAQYLPPWSYANFEFPEDTDEIQYYYCLSGDDLYLLQDIDDEDDDEAETQKKAAQEAEEERKKRESALKAIHKRAYKLRMDFAKSVRENLKTLNKEQDAIERIAATIMLRGYGGGLQEKATADYYDIKGGFKQAYNAKEGDERETLYEFRKRIAGEIYTSDQKEASIKCLFAAAYLGLESSEHSFYRSYYLDHRTPLSLTELYSLLCTLGYEMSDEEKQLQDGTHELFTALEATKND